MNRPPRRKRQFGFSLIELMTALAIFLLICGATFTLLGVSQQRYRTDSQVLNSFQEARLGMDQIVRDVNDSGFPPPNSFAVKVNANFNLYASSPFAWSPNYPGTPCQIGTAGGGTCANPGDFDLIIETDIDPQNNNGVDWVRYQLLGTTLSRGVLTPKVAGDPVAAIDGALVMVPYVQNVMNNATPAQIAQFQTFYPGMFPGGIPVPIFSYTCDAPSVPPNVPQSCLLAGADNSPKNIRDIEITLIVMTPQPDAQTGQPRLLELHGRGRRTNPNQ